jgi:hypothetical protein
LWAGPTSLKTRVDLFFAPKTGESDSGKNATREARLRVDLQNISSKPSDPVWVEWTYVVEESEPKPHKAYTHGSKTVDLKAAEHKIFETDGIEVSRRDNHPKNSWIGYQIRISVGGKMIFEDFNPLTVKRMIEQNQKDQDKN